jgi:hypothetical protein
VVPSSEVRPGDLWAMKNENGSWQHMGIVTSAVSADGLFSRVDGDVQVTEGGTFAVVEKRGSVKDYDPTFIRITDYYDYVGDPNSGIA